MNIFIEKLENYLEFIVYDYYYYNESLDIIFDSFIIISS